MKPICRNGFLHPQKQNRSGGEKSGRRRGSPRRPPTPPCVRFPVTGLRRTYTSKFARPAGRAKNKRPGLAWAPLRLRTNPETQPKCRVKGWQALAGRGAEPRFRRMASTKSALSAVSRPPAGYSLPAAAGIALECRPVGFTPPNGFPKRAPLAAQRLCPLPEAILTLWQITMNLPRNYPPARSMTRSIGRRRK